MTYNFKAIEKKWQKKWEEGKVFEVKDNSKKKKFYVLDMFPYPSGAGLHMGHAFVFSLGDIFARFKRLMGFNVLYPIGYDALGLPAENAAIKAGTHPEDYTKKSMKNFMKQQKAMGWSYDWSRGVNTSSPDFYKWDQWIFLQMLNKGIAYQKESAVNWCPKCDTVLANEQVIDGKCWRHEDTSVVVKHLKQWFFKTTDYADELLEGLDKIDWPERAKTLQRNWIGKSYGTEIEFEIETPTKISNVIIVPAKIKDAEEISFLQVSGWRDNNTSLKMGVTIDFLEKEKGFTLPPKKERVESTKKYIKENPENNYVALIDNKVVGWIGLTFEDKKKLSYGLYVHPDYRGKGIGGSLVDFIHKKYSDYKFFIEVVSTNEKAIKFYESFGYVKKSQGKHKVGELFLPVDVMYGENSGLIEENIKNEKWPIFTTRPDTIYGVTFMVISAQHEKLMELVTKEQEKDVENFLKKLKSVSEKEQGALEKEGVFTGSYAINPINGERVPVYAGNFVLADYGSGMVMAVPAHDQRDFEFAKKYGIEIKQVVKDGEIKKQAHTGSGKLINSGEFNGLDNKKAIEEITKYLSKKKLGKKTVNFKLRDWGVSRQRYWGTPIPIVYCDKCGVVAVDEKDLPIKLPKDVKFGKGNPLLTNEKWIKTKCPKCSGNARRETDTMDTFVNSSWYMWRYCDSKNSKKIFDKKKVDYWGPVDQYIGGPEHITMHLIYARFYTKVLRDLGLLDFDEPALKYFTQGIVKASNGEKMSKSKPETLVDPMEMLEKFGADTLRFFLVSVAGADTDFNWDDKGMQSSFKFLKRIFDYYDKVDIGKTSSEIDILLNKTLKNVAEYVEDFKYRKAVIEIRALFDKIEKEKVSKDVLEKFLQMLHVFCPHITEELWSKFGNKDFISLSKWPVVDRVKLKVKKKEVDFHSNVVGQVKRILGKVKAEKVYVYVMPFEVEKLDVKKIAKEIGKDVKIFSTADKKKYDPKNMSKRARPGLVGVYLE